MNVVGRTMVRVTAFFQAIWPLPTSFQGESYFAAEVDRPLTFCFRRHRLELRQFGLAAVGLDGFVEDRPSVFGCRR